MDVWIPVSMKDTKMMYSVPKRSLLDVTVGLKNAGIVILIPVNIIKMMRNKESIPHAVPVCCSVFPEIQRCSFC